MIVKLNVLGLKAIDSIKKSKWFSSQSSLEAFKKYIWIYKEQKGHPRFIRLQKKKKEKRKKRVKTAMYEWENDDSWHSSSFIQCM